MNHSFLRMIAFTAIAGVAFIGCQKEELNHSYMYHLFKS